MGRYELYREPVSSRIAKAVSHKLTAPLRTKFAVRIIEARGLRKSVTAFFAVAGLCAVSIVDPYSGAMASTFSMNYYQDQQVDEQIYGWETTQTISFSRGGFNIVTGKDAAALFVELADIPEPGTNKAIAFGLVTKAGWGRDQYSCLVKLWERESNWRVTATNRASGAYGIPQALPGIKMASEGADWLTNPETQIRWGVGYIKGRYGSPCGALAHSNKFNWY